MKERSRKIWNMAGDVTVNFYEVLGVTRESTHKEIIKAYRKKALICHPDKNPDNPKAEQLFHQLSEALEILTDAKAKAAYDSVLKAKELAKLRTQALDAKRKKFKEDLEARETFAQQTKDNDSQAKRNLEEEIKRLREEGSRLLKEQQEQMKAQLEKNSQNVAELLTPKVKVKWRSFKDDHNNGGYNEEILTNIFMKYGPVMNVIVSLKKNGLAIVEFTEPSHAMLALEFEHGFEHNPLKLTWLQQPKASTVSQNSVSHSSMSASETVIPDSKMADHQQSCPTDSGNDFESMVLSRMKKAQQGKTITGSKSLPKGN